MARPRVKVPDEFKKTIRRGASGMDQLIYYAEHVPLRTRQAISMSIMRRNVRTWEDLIDLNLYVASHVTAGNLPIEVAEEVRATLGEVYKMIAEINKEKGSVAAMSTLDSIMEGFRTAEEKPMIASYTTIEEMPEGSEEYVPLVRRK